LTPDGQPQNDTDNEGICGVVSTGVPYADVVVLMDESGSMAFAQQFSVGLVADLDTAMLAEGIGATTAGGNRFGLVGFGGSDTHEPGHSHWDFG
jgi:chromosome condensin MukBEF MukE localization factor